MEQKHGDAEQHQHVQRNIVIAGEDLTSPHQSLKIILAALNLRELELVTWGFEAQGNSWKSYSLSNETSTQRSSDVDYEGNELQPVFVNRVSSTRSRTSQDEATHQQRRFIKSRFEAGKTDGSSFPKEWAEEGTSARGSSVCEVVCKLFDTPQVCLY